MADEKNKSGAPELPEEELISSGQVEKEPAQEQSAAETDYLGVLQQDAPVQEEPAAAEQTQEPADAKETGDRDSKAAVVAGASTPPMKKDGEFTDVSSSSPREKNPFRRIAKWFRALPKKKKVLYSILCFFLCLVLILGTALGIFITGKFNLMGDKINDPGEDIIYDDDDYGVIEGDLGTSDFKDALKEWATTGNENIMSSKNVINVLLIGADSRSGTNSGNTDTMMLVSLNRKTKKITMVSFLRDSYLYAEGDSSSYCTKLNAAFSMGGAKGLMKTIEHNYKIDIDNYVMVNFESFKAIIDSMGGVTVDVQQYEADYINNRYKTSIVYGENRKLTGREALYFCRVRGCDADGDVSRTRRQRQVVNSIMDSVKNASVSDLNKYLNVLLPYVETGYGKSEILSLGMRALTGGWAGFERTQLQMPDADTRDSGSAGSAWIWVVDYQKAAQTLQTAIYGTTNIQLEENRTSLIDIYHGAYYSGSGSGSGSNADAGNDTPSTAPVKDTTNPVKKPTTEPQPSEESTTPVLDTEPESFNTEPSAPSTEPAPTEPVTTPPTEPPVTEPASGNGGN